MDPSQIQSIVENAIQAALVKFKGETIQGATSAAENVASNFVKKHEQTMKSTIEHSTKAANLKGKGNKHQFEFCQNLTTTLDEVDENITNNKLEDAKIALENGKNLIRKRMKLIKLADREDWATVAEYMSDDMASDSEDEKRINRARRAATAKLEKQKKLRVQRFKTNRSYYNRPPYSSPEARQNDHPKRQCWGCNRFGHFYSQCPFKGSNKYESLNRVPFRPRDNNTKI